MKTSKIIFISLISALAFLILIASVDVRINKSRNSVTSANIKVNKQSLKAFKVLVINSSDFTLIHGDSSYIKITYNKDSLMRQLNYSLKNDTLRVSDLSQSHRIDGFPSVELTSSDSLNTIIMKNSEVTFNNYNWRRMNFNIDKSYLWFNQNKNVISSINSLDILAKNHSNINSDKFKVENLSINLLKSEASLELVAVKISGSLSDSSRIDVRHAGEISMKTDSTSTLNVNY